MPLSKPIAEIVETYDRYLGEDMLDGDDCGDHDDPVPEAMLRSGLHRTGETIGLFEGFVRAYVAGVNFVD